MRSIKNRYGPTDESGVFEMTGTGLAEVPNPSALFLNPERGPVAGAAVFAGIEGSRPVLVEIQALVAPSPLGTPRRAVVGWDSGRLAMILAVLDAREGRELQRLLDDDGRRFISEVLWATALTALVFHEAAEDRTT